MLQRFRKPWFVHRPSQLVRRLLGSLSTAQPGFRPIPTSWGTTIRADATKTIGKSIRTTGLYDLAVSEAIARLVDPGDRVIDAGGNVGYMTVLASVAAGATGEVITFEPHPDLFGVLSNNVADARARYQIAATDLHNAALGETVGRATLVLPSDFGDNDGIAHISANAPTGSRTIDVPLETIDSVLGDRSAKLLKIDVEGYEAPVLRGTVRALAEKRIQHVLFEDHAIQGSEVVAILRDHGYRVYSLGWAMDGLEVRPVEQGTLANAYEAPNFLATVDDDAMRARCTAKGWTVLTHSLVTRCGKQA